MLLSFGGMATGFVMIFRGIQVMSCGSVSFSRSFTTCYAGDFGALPGPVAGVGLISVGVLLFVAAMLRMATVK
jgi:hypothetical protein